MSALDTYIARSEARGNTMRESYRRREVRKLTKKMPDNLSYQNVVIYEPPYTYNIDRFEGLIDEVDGVYHRNIAVINSDSMNKKYIYSMPGDDFKIGSLLFWNDNYWLITERDANTTIHTKARILQCNYLLKWVSEDHNICNQWCTVLDAATTNGEYEDKKFIATRGDVVISMHIGRNEMVDAWGRLTRFIIDDSNAKHKMAFSLTRPFKGGYTYNGEGIYKFILKEDTTNDDDNQVLGIADFFKHFPRTECENVYSDDYSNPEYTEAPSPERTSWL